MNCRFADFRCKEVINICDGCRLGYVGDVECRLPDGQITALIIPGPVLKRAADEKSPNSRPTIL